MQIDSIQFENMLLNLETLVGINHSTRVYEEMLDNAVKSTKLQLNLPENADSVYNGEGRDIVDQFVTQLTMYMKTFSLYTLSSLWTGSFKYNLREVNYLGSELESVTKGLMAVQRQQHQHSASDWIDSVVSASKDIELDVIKRLVILMVVFYRLGLLDACSIIAAYLFWGVTTA